MSVKKKSAASSVAVAKAIVLSKKEPFDNDRLLLQELEKTKKTFSSILNNLSQQLLEI